MLKVRTIILEKSNQQVHKFTTDNNKVAYVTCGSDEWYIIHVRDDMEWLLNPFQNPRLRILSEREITAMEDFELKDGYPYYLTIMPCDVVHEVEHIHPRVTLHSFEGHSEMICICKHEPNGMHSYLGSLTLDRLRPKHTFSIEYDDRKTKQRLMELAELLG